MNEMANFMKHVFRVCSVLLLIKGIRCVHGANKEEDRAAVSMYQDMCPFTALCMHNATRSLVSDYITSCCRSCSCSSDCLTGRGNCCPDIQNERKGVITETDEAMDTCALPIIDYFNHISTDDYNGINKGLRRYFVLNHCPESGKDTDESRLCGDLSHSSLDTRIWVTDLKTGWIYANKHCAECNHVANYRFWDLLIYKCVSFIEDDYFVENLTALNIPQDCRLILHAPRNIDASVNFCFRPDISSCNTTGQWKTYNKTVEQFCNAYNLPFIEEKMLHSKVYRNVFCFLCNAPETTDVPYVCRSLPTESEIKDYLTPFTGVVDLAVLGIRDGGVLDQKKTKCKANEVEDPLKVECLQLRCPVMQTPVHGSCQKITKSTINLVVTVFFKLYTVSEKSIFGSIENLNYKKNQIGNRVQRSLYQKIELSLAKKRCRKCEKGLIFKSKNLTQLGQASVPDVFGIGVGLYSSKTCQYEKILEGMTSITKDRLVVQFQDEEFLVFEVQAEKTSDVAPKYRAACPLNQHVDFVALQRCAMVSVGPRHYSVMMSRAKSKSQKKLVYALFGVDKNSTENSAKINEGTSRNVTASVCFDEFKAVVAQLGKTQGLAVDASILIFSLYFSMVSVT